MVNNPCSEVTRRGFMAGLLATAAVVPVAGLTISSAASTDMVWDECLAVWMSMATPVSLEQWGFMLGVRRLPGESDLLLRKRLMDGVLEGTPAYEVWQGMLERQELEQR